MTPTYFCAYRSCKMRYTCRHATYPCGNTTTILHGGRTYSHNEGKCPSYRPTSFQPITFFAETQCEMRECEDCDYLSDFTTLHPYGAGYVEEDTSECLGDVNVCPGVRNAIEANATFEQENLPDEA